MTRVPIILALNNVRSLHNVGAIFRCADATNIEKIVLSGLTPTPPRHEIEKTALGATQTVPWEYVRLLDENIAQARDAGYQIAALEQGGGSISLFAAQSQPTFLIVGHERTGVEDALLAHCDVLLEIPMYGQSAHSLNISTATAVALYHLTNNLLPDLS